MRPANVLLLLAIVATATLLAGCPKEQTEGPEATPARAPRTLTVFAAASLTEPLGTGVIGVGLIVLLLGPFMGKEYAFLLFFTAFMASSIPGAVIGYFLLKTMRKTKILEQRQIPGA